MAFIHVLAAAGNEPATDNSTTKALLSGAAIAIFAFALAQVATWLRDRGAKRRRDEAVTTALRLEIRALRPVAENDLRLIRHELTLLPSNQSIVNPLDPLGSDFFELVRVEPPPQISRSADLLIGLRDVARRTKQTDEMIRAREAFRSANRALGSFASTLTAYDQLIETWLTELLHALKDLEALMADVGRH